MIKEELIVFVRVEFFRSVPLVLNRRLPIALSNTCNFQEKFQLPAPYHGVPIQRLVSSHGLEWSGIAFTQRIVIPRKSSSRPAWYHSAPNYFRSVSMVLNGHALPYGVHATHSSSKEKFKPTGFVLTLSQSTFDQFSWS